VTFHVIIILLLVLLMVNTVADCISVMTRVLWCKALVTKCSWL